jgi:hypothetical protein
LPKVFLDWEQINPWDKKTAKEFRDAIMQVAESYGQKETSFSKLP